MIWIAQLKGTVTRYPRLLSLSCEHRQHDMIHDLKPDGHRLSLRMWRRHEQRHLHVHVIRIIQKRLPLNNLYSRRPSSPIKNPSTHQRTAEMRGA